MELHMQRYCASIVRRRPNNGRRELLFRVTFGRLGNRSHSVKRVIRESEQPSRDTISTPVSQRDLKQRTAVPLNEPSPRPFEIANEKQPESALTDFRIRRCPKNEPRR